MLLVTHCVQVSATDIRFHGNKQALQVRIFDAPLHDVLRTLAEYGLLDVVTAPVLDDRIDLDANAISLSTLLRRLLRQYSYVICETASINELWILPDSDEIGATTWRIDTRAVNLRLRLTDPDPGIREEAVLALSDVEPGLAFDLAMSASNDPDVSVREASAAILEDIAATDFVLE